MMEPRIIASDKRVEITIDRLCHQLIEKHGHFVDTCIIGIQAKGAALAERLFLRLRQLTDTKNLQLGKLDVTFYRDDFRTRQEPLKAFPTEIDFLVENKNVIIVDDVLYTGRTIQSALTALQHYGRPSKVELLCLVDRRFTRHLPISANYVGFKVDALDQAYIKVSMKTKEGIDKIELYSKKI